MDARVEWMLLTRHGDAHVASSGHKLGERYLREWICELCFEYLGCEKVSTKKRIRRTELPFQFLPRHHRVDAGHAIGRNEAK